jgi:tetratricopeptide (TPR) repeat protein
MATKKDKVTKKELAAPDEFQESMGKLVEFFRLYGAWVGAAALVIILTIAGGVIVSRVSTSGQIDRSTAFLKAAAPVGGAELPDREADAAARLKTAGEAQARAKQAVVDLDKFLADNAKSDLVGVARLAKGAAALKAGDAAGAVVAFKAFLDADPKSPVAWLAWESYGIAADQAGQRAEAEKAFGEMAKAEGSLARGYANLHLGDLYNPLARAKADDPADPAKAREFYGKGLDAMNGPEEAMPAAQLVARKTLEERLKAVQ